MQPIKTASPARHDRRTFLKSTLVATGAVVFGVPMLVRGRNLNSKLNIAVIGAGGKGASDTNCCAAENIFALCDVDSDRCGGQLEKYPDARFYRDFRRMFEAVGGEIDAVDVSTPDHVHAIAAAQAMRLGKHVYCQKPLTQTIYEARHLRDLARSTGLVTQMGNQGSAADGLRRAVECVQAGIIGQVSQVHIWTNRPIWPQGILRPPGEDPVPEYLSWDLWLGPAPVRPYKANVYHPFNWRGWVDFGTGALGDMACHTVNMPFRALELGYPTEIEVEAVERMEPETYPLGSRIRFDFPARQSGRTRPPSRPVKGAELLMRQEPHPDLAPVTLWWYDGGKPDAEARGGHDGSNKPSNEAMADIESLLGEIPPSGCLLIGDRGVLFSPDDYGERFFIKTKDEDRFRHYQKHPDVVGIPQVIPRNAFSGDNDQRQHLEWIAAIKASRPQMCYSNFDCAALLTEIMLLGCVSLRSCKKILWDGPGMRALNCPEAARFIQRQNREGWTLA